MIFLVFGIRFQTVQRSALCRSRRELSNAYFVAKFGFDTAENEPFKFARSPRTDPPGDDAATVSGGTYFPRSEPDHAVHEPRRGPRVDDGDCRPRRNVPTPRTPRSARNSPGRLPGCRSATPVVRASSAALSRDARRRGGRATDPTAAAAAAADRRRPRRRRPGRATDPAAAALDRGGVPTKYVKIKSKITSKSE